MAAHVRRCVVTTVVAACAACSPSGPAVPERATLELGDVLGGADTLHARAWAPRPFEFPADHGPHPEFRTEWWYFTGNVTSADGRAFGYQLTFFRSALADSASFAGRSGDESSEWRARHAYMAHFAVSDLGGERIHAAERFARDALGLAGARAEPFRVWLEDWHATGAGPAAPGNDIFPLRLRAHAGDVAIDLLLEQGRPIALQGEAGLSRKGPEPGNASYYYSITRMPTTGTIRVGRDVMDVRGRSWLDREWSTSVLGDGLVGWDWMALQLGDSSDLMLYRLRRHDGLADPHSAGLHVADDGTTTPLHAADFSMTATRTWRSPASGAVYPVAWRVQVPQHGLDIDVTAAFADQELDLAVLYWEGAVRVAGHRHGERVDGRGYLEMTGYRADTPQRRPRPAWPLR
ncbi:MAG TPA: lipocalin-like domain-containing protein [Longimicrobiales bacterium]|nr:lipocalin-like domain-containing protein [Longimicrobiales bacterium]